MSRIAVVVKGYPRLSETFIAQEIFGLQERGLKQLIIALRQPYDPYFHEVHRKITAPVLYLPEYLKDDPERVKAAARWAKQQATYKAVRRAFELDLARRPTPELYRRWGQACVLAHELPEDVSWIHTHYLHTPCTVTRYAAGLSGRRWSFSAHAKDIWTTSPDELTQKISGAEWGVTCTKANLSYLQKLTDTPDKISLVYHGLDFSEFPYQENRAQSAATQTIVSVGRMVEKKGYDVLLKALSQLPLSLNWRFTHIGGGEQEAALKALSCELGLEDHIQWLGPMTRSSLVEVLSCAQVFVLPSRIARNGDRDGLPNVLMEAQAMGLCCISTHISAIPELIEDGETGTLVPPDNPPALAAAIKRLLENGRERHRLGQNAQKRVRRNFACHSGIDYLHKKFGQVG
ncbi:glycosyltransferase family 4 protein [Flexibacterium corallicola]|uniref:glycosyltransferase family 4 protein n=1 Tax=Flexibacterium corallicola TaxID=3037259 RepID=UPI00286F8491|nr:glycosyltransferase family 4 protein [Pseudovibrio sp. M1P-2-3]